MCMVLWIGEEENIFGGKQYYNFYKKNVGKFSLVMEFDYGIFKFVGIVF